MTNRQKRFQNLKALTLCVFLGLLLFTISSPLSSNEAYAKICFPCTPCCGALCVQGVLGCDTNCGCTSTKQTCPKIGKCVTGSTIAHITDEFIRHRDWLILTVWDAHVLPAMLLMTEQLTTTAMYQALGIGMLLDAKHQLETQALFQKLHARAHKDYHPSRGVCTFGTNMRSLAASDRNAEFSQIVVAARSLQRNMLSGEIYTSSGPGSKTRSDLDVFLRVFCNPSDNAEGLKKLCDEGGEGADRYNKDVDYTRTLDRPFTLEIDFTPNPGIMGGIDGATPDENDLFALGANLYGHESPPHIPEAYLASDDMKPKLTGALSYMDLRALAAKRAVAANSFAAIVGMKAQGEEEVKPYIKALLKKMGIPEEEIKDMMGYKERKKEKPSYYLQMELLTKKLYQRPYFYTELYDKPANVARTDVAMRAIGNIQKRDIYRSLLRSEAIMSVWLETLLDDSQKEIQNQTDRLTQEGKVLPIPE